MRVVVALEVVVGIGNEAFQVGREQQIGHDVARVVGGVVAGSVAHANGDMPGINRSLELECNGVEGLVVELHATDADGLHVDVLMIDEEQAVGQWLPVFIDNEEVADTGG